MRSNYQGYTSAEVAVLVRISELARRFGLRPSDADASLSIVDHPDFESGIYELRFEERPDAPGTDKGDRFDKMMDALGCRHSSGVQAEEIDEMEDIVERAMSRAPRARSVG